MCNDNNDFSGKDFPSPPIDVIDLTKKEFIHSSSKVYGNNVPDTVLGASNKTKSTPA